MDSRSSLKAGLTAPLKVPRHEFDIRRDDCPSESGVPDDEPYIAIPVVVDENIRHGDDKGGKSLRNRKRFATQTEQQWPQKRQKTSSSDDHQRTTLRQNITANQLLQYTSVPSIGLYKSQSKTCSQKPNYVKLHFHGVLPPLQPSLETNLAKAESIVEAIPGSVKINNKILHCSSIPRGQGGGVSSNEGSIFLLSVVDEFLDHFNDSHLTLKMTYLSSMNNLSQQKQGRKSFTHKDNTTLFNLTKAKTNFLELSSKLSAFLSAYEISFPILMNFALGFSQGYFQFDDEFKLHIPQNPVEGLISVPSISTTTTPCKSIQTPNQFKAQINHLIHTDTCNTNYYQSKGLM